MGGGCILVLVEGGGPRVDGEDDVSFKVDEMREDFWMLDGEWIDGG